MDKYFQNITLTDITALGGLIIASITLGWNILNEIRKVPRARVYAMIAKIVQPGIPQQDNECYFSITIANIGSRPIRINGIGYDGYKWWWHPFKRKKFIIVPKHLPIYLKDGEEHIEYFPYTPVQFKKLLDDNIQTIYVYDSAGRIHRMSRWKFIQFRRALKRHVREKMKNK